MDPPPHQWRPPPPPPPPQSNEICPTCSTPHFPFCPPPPPPPPPPPFATNPNFPYHPRPPPPPYDPYYGSSPNPTPFQNPNPNSDPNFNPGYYGNGGLPIQPRHNDCGPAPYGANGFSGSSEGDRNSYKRMRVEENFGGYSNETYYQGSSARVLSDDERRLKLIRDHGVSGTGDAPPAPPPGPVAVPAAPLFDRGVDNFSNGSRYTLDEYRGRGNMEMDRYSDASSGFIGGGMDPIQRDGSSGVSGYDPGPVNMLNSANYNSYSTPYENSVNHVQHPIQNSGSLGPRDGIAKFPQPPPPPPPPPPYPAYPSNYMQNDSKQPLRNNVNMAFDGSHLSGLTNSSTPSSAGRGSYPMYSSMVTPDTSRPPLPTSPPPPLPLDPPMHITPGMKLYASPPSSTVGSLFPVPVASAGVATYHQAAPGNYLGRPTFGNKQIPDVSTGLSHPEHQTMPGRMLGHYADDRQLVPSKQIPLDKPKVIDASHIFKPPHRSVRADHFVVILRGLPGSGKSYLAKMLRDIEVENGGDVPRIYSMDDYFMTEVEKVDEADASKSSGSARRKRPLMKKVMEYCYEPEMEEAYRSSMLKAYKKTVEDGTFAFIIVDDRNVRVADFAQFWAIGKASGYEVYILEATYKDPEGCAARNVHSFSLDDIQKMAGQWEDTPSLYLQLDAKSLFHGDDLKESGIQEVDMDMDDGHDEGCLSIGGTLEADKDPPLHGEAPDDFSIVKKWNTEGDNATEVRELRRSKWSEDVGEQETESAENFKGSANALSSLSQAYGKKRKSLRWGDQVGYTGFSIGALKKANATSLIIGPGAGYNLKSNPLSKEENLQLSHGSGEPKKRSVFQEQLRAEHQSFKAVFDRRRQRIGGLDLDDE